MTKIETVPESVMLEAEAEDPERFHLSREERKRKKRRSPKKLSREQIFRRITSFLGGFEVDPEESTDEETSEQSEQEETEDANLETNV